MQEKSTASNELLPHLFRVEYAKMTAVLCRLFGLEHIEIAEDIASDTFLRATEVWSINGLPDNPVAWLYTVAKNKTKDYLKRVNFFDRKIKSAFLFTGLQTDEQTVDFTQEHISDSEIEMIFVVCNPVNSPEAQICLALQILCGFSVEEISHAFLCNKETIKKRLFRARENLRKQKFILKVLQETEVKTRLDNVLTTLYLLFNEGYFSRSNNNLIRKELCSEAMRLTFTLAENPQTHSTKVNALLSLMCFQSSRLDARINEVNEPVLFEEQDKSLWNKELIEKGNYYLLRACSEGHMSKYHLEASIAFWHTQTINDTRKWSYILQLYNQLLITEYSLSAALNRAFVFAKVYGTARAIDEVEKLNFQSSHYYHSLLGYLYSTVNVDKAITHYNNCVSLSTSETERKLLRKKILLLSKKKNST